MNTLRDKIKALYLLLFPMANIQTPQSKHLCDVAYANLGKDLSPTQDAFGCAETACTLLTLAFGDTYKTLSTKEMYDHFLVDTYYARVLVPLAGDIILSPTGYGNGNIANGHVGVVGNNDAILSNNSYDSKLEINYNLKSWKARYGDVGGFPVTYWRRII